MKAIRISRMLNAFPLSDSEADVLISIVTLAIGLSSMAAAQTCGGVCGGLPPIYTVDTNADSPDLAIDGACKAVTGGCTLRAAIDEANANPCNDIISIPTWTSDFRLTLPGVEEANKGGGPRRGALSR